MKILIYSILFLIIFDTLAFTQSVLDYQPGTGVVIEPGADVCADDININGTFAGGGTICGATAYIMNFTGIIQGFYNASTNSMVPDTARIYLHSAISPYVKIDSANDVLNSSGTGTFIFSNPVNGSNYYIVFKQRNSIETWSKTTQAFTSSALTYNFSSAATQAYGDNMTQVDVSPVKFAIYNGDVDQDGTIDLSDIVNIFNNANSFLSGYVVTDVTGDDYVDLSDITLTFNNAYLFVVVISP